MGTSIRVWGLAAASFALLISACGCTGGLHRAAMDGEVQEVRRLVAAGADVNAFDEEGLRPLHYAALFGQTEVVRVLLDAGAEMHAGTRVGGHTSLHYAARGRSEPVMRLLLSRGGDPNVPSDFGGGPLLEAAVAGHKGVAQMLLDAGADVNARRSHGATPLHAAAGRGHSELVALFLAAGADVRARDDDGETPLNWAGAGKETAGLLLEAGAEHDIFTAIALGEDDLVREFLEQDPELAHARGARQSTPLHEAAHYGGTELVELLLSTGADIEARDKADATPLHRAVSNRTHRYAVVELLLERGADVNARNDSGNSPLVYARRTYRDERMVQLLQRYGGEE